MVEYLNEYKYKPMPEPPPEVIKYAKSKVDDREFEMKEGYWKRIDFFGWFKQLDYWRAINLSNYEWLKHLLKKTTDYQDQVSLKHAMGGFEEDMAWCAYGREFIRHLAGFSLIVEVK